MKESRYFKILLTVSTAGLVLLPASCGVQVDLSALKFLPPDGTSSDVSADADSVQRPDDLVVDLDVEDQKPPDTKPLDIKEVVVAQKGCWDIFFCVLSGDKDCNKFDGNCESKCAGGDYWEEDKDYQEGIKKCYLAQCDGIASTEDRWRCAYDNCFDKLLVCIALDDAIGQCHEGVQCLTECQKLPADAQKKLCNLNCFKELELSEMYDLSNFGKKCTGITQWSEPAAIAACYEAMLKCQEGAGTWKCSQSLECVVQSFALSDPCAGVLPQDCEKAKAEKFLSCIAKLDDGQSKILWNSLVCTPPFYPPGHNPFDCLANALVCFQDKLKGQKSCADVMVLLLNEFEQSDPPSDYLWILSPTMLAAVSPQEAVKLQDALKCLKDVWGTPKWKQAKDSADPLEFKKLWQNCMNLCNS